jgi:putative ABC transport system ATP-binding protein
LLLLEDLPVTDAVENSLQRDPAGSRNACRPILRTENVTKRFRQGTSVVDALKQVSLSISPGEFVAVMGASGSGKSTLLHVAAGLTKIDGGRVLVDGHDLTSLSDRRLTQFRRQRIGLVFQAFNLIPTLTAEDNIALPLLASGRGELLEARIEPLLVRLGLSDRRQHRPDALSGGEQQRVAIARALITDPAIVLADEPTGSLDSVTGQSICRLLRELCHEQGRTIVVVTHEPNVAAWARRVLVMKDGCLLTQFELPGQGDSQTLAAMYQQAIQATAQE